MSAIEKGPAERGSYRHVVYREDRDPDLAISIPLYDNPRESRAVLFCGRVVHMVFLADSFGLDWCTKRGWVDVTDEWSLYEEAVEIAGGLSQNVSRLLHTVVDRTYAPNAPPAWWSAEQAAEWLDVPATTLRGWRTELQVAGLLQADGDGRQTRYRLTDRGVLATGRRLPCLGARPAGLAATA